MSSFTIGGVPVESGHLKIVVAQEFEDIWQAFARILDEYPDAFKQNLNDFEEWSNCGHE